MDWILLLVLIVLAMIIAIAIKFHKKIIIRIAVVITVVIAVFVIKEIVLYDSDKIMVLTDSENGDGSFEIDIKGHRTFYNGVSMKFTCEYSEKDMVYRISNQYKNVFFDDYNDVISVIDNNQIYTIRFMNVDKFFGKNRYSYIITRNYVYCDIEPEEYIKIIEWNAVMILII